MSTAVEVPPTFDLQGDDAMQTLRITGWSRLLKGSIDRFRSADGTTHSRSLAYQIALASLPGLIAFVGFTTFFNMHTLRKLFERSAVTLAPGPAGQIFHEAFHQGSSAARSSGLTALFLGLIATVTASTTAMAQIERGANRLYGVEDDRPVVKKYGVAFLLTISAGLLSAIAFILFIAGGAIAKSGPSAGWSDAVVTAWRIGRWPAGILLMIAAISIILRVSPNRRQPQLSWLTVGATIAVASWVVLTALLALYLSISKNFGQTYGPLAGMLGFLFWSFLSSLALFFGVAFAAQLEAVRARAT